MGRLLVERMRQRRRRVLLHQQQRCADGSITTALERLREKLREPRRVVDVFDALFRRRVGGDPHLLCIATAESVAHLNYVVQLGETRETVAEGVAWYSLKPTA